MGFINNKASSQRYKNVAIKIKESLEFMNALGINSDNTPQLKEISFYTSHEGLLLPYEEALLRTSQDSEETYATSAHMIWIGDRTRFKESAHVEFCRGLANPIGIKCSFNTDIDELLEIIDILNPSNENGKIILIEKEKPEKEIIKKLNKEYPKFLKKINNKKLTQKQKKKEAEEFTKWLEDLAENTPNDKQFK